MPKYLIEASYTSEGAKGLLKDGGSKRRQAAEQAIKSAGGKPEEIDQATKKSVKYTAPGH